MHSILTSDAGVSSINDPLRPHSWHLKQLLVNPKGVIIGRFKPSLPRARLAIRVTGLSHEAPSQRKAGFGVPVSRSVFCVSQTNRLRPQPLHQKPEQPPLSLRAHRPPTFPVPPT